MRSKWEVLAARTYEERVMALAQAAAARKDGRWPKGSEVRVFSRVVRAGGAAIGVWVVVVRRLRRADEGVR